MIIFTSKSPPSGPRLFGPLRYLLKDNQYMAGERLQSQKLFIKNVRGDFSYLHSTVSLPSPRSNPTSVKTPPNVDSWQMTNCLFLSPSKQTPLTRHYFSLSELSWILKINLNLYTCQMRAKWALIKRAICQNNGRALTHTCARTHKPKLTTP